MPATDTFEVDEHGSLCRHGNPRSGRRYTHRCPLAVFEAVAHMVERCGQAGINEQQVHASLGVPYSKASVALAFMESRGLVSRCGHRRRACTEATHMDAMIEYHALREGEADQDVQGHPEAGPDGPAPTGA